jgi:DNA-directed RNA polymerase subunit RPC12/RpoP
MVKIIERIPAHYETQEVVQDLGRVYRWCPEQVVLECGACGTRKTFERSTLITTLVRCEECGSRCSARVREELVLEKLAEEEYIHPWRYWRTKENAGIPI